MLLCALNDYDMIYDDDTMTENDGDLYVEDLLTLVVFTCLSEY